MTSPLIANRFILRQPLGYGAMGEVFCAEDRLTGGVVALKRLIAQPGQWAFGGRTSPDGDATDARVLLAREFQILASLRHPNIIDVIDYGFDDDRRPYFTMDYIPGARTLLEVGSGRSLLERIDLIVQMLQALGYLHQRGVVHRDLKPDNVLVTPSGQVKVLDFGLALSMDARTRSDPLGAVGTLRYMAPEILRDQLPDARADIYSAGIIAYELLTGRHPFPSVKLSELIRRILNEAADLLPVYEACGAAGDLIAPIIGWMMSKDPDDRFATAFDVIRALSDALGRPAVLETHAIRESYLRAARFVGRDEELAQLQAALERTYAAQSSFWLVSGESGAGKSRLVDELRVRAMVNGIQVMTGTAIMGNGQAHSPWREPIRRMIITAELDENDASVLSDIVPDLGTLTEREVAPAAPLNGPQQQARLAAALIRLLHQQHSPTLIVLEDLHWAAESVGLLYELLPRLHNLPVMIVGTVRSEEISGLAQLPADGHIDLKRFSLDVTAKLAQSMLGKVATPELIDLIQTETEGNPFFVVETMRALADAAGSLPSVGEMRLPNRILAGGVQQVLQRRLDLLPEWARPALAAAAVLGRSLDATLLLKVVGQDVGWYARWVAECTSASVFELHEGQLRFSHDKLREAVLLGLADADIRQLNRAAALVIEQSYPGNPAYIPLLYQHWRAAGADDQMQHYAEPAAAEAVRSNRNALALDITEHALSRLPATSLKQRAPLLRHTADALHALGRLHEAEATFDEMLTAGEALNDDALRIVALLGKSNTATTLDEQRRGAELAQDALRIAERLGEPRLLARSLQTSAMSHALRGDLRSVLQNYRRAYTLAHGIGDLVLMTESLTFLGFYSQILDAPDALSYFADGRHLAERVGHQQMLSMCLTGLGVGQWLQGDRDAALPLLERAQSIKLSLRDYYLYAWGEKRIGLLYFVDGMYDEARLCLDRALPVLRKSNSARDIVEVLCLSACIDSALRQDAAVWAQLNEARVMPLGDISLGTTRMILIAAAYALLRHDQPEEAAELLGAALADMPRSYETVLQLSNYLMRLLGEQLSPSTLENALSHGATLDTNQIMFSLPDRLHARAALG
jgi:tetratricopeptide (TPR) repeat protein